jgi:peptidoglycan/xylan/chitin deacetylase (PgdA/CDA1 family)
MIYLTAIYLCVLLGFEYTSENPVRFAAAGEKDAMIIEQGAVIRGSRANKQLALVFTGHEFADGGDVILNTLNDHNVKASFFLTGDFYRAKKYRKLIASLKAQGHYLGAHSDKHLLYCDWHKRDSLLVTRQEFRDDLIANYNAMMKHGIDKQDALYFLPPYEWYNLEIAKWAKELGLRLVNYTPGTLSHGDYTIPEMGQRYYESEKILSSIYELESDSADGMNGFILLMHIGVSPKRTDKFYQYLDDLLDFLLNRDYKPVRIDILLGNLEEQD